MNSPSAKRYSGGTRVLNERASDLNVVDVTDFASHLLHCNLLAASICLRVLVRVQSVDMGNFQLFGVDVAVLHCVDLRSLFKVCT